MPNKTLKNPNPCGLHAWKLTTTKKAQSNSQDKQVSDSHKQEQILYHTEQFVSSSDTDKVKQALKAQLIYSKNIA